LPKQNVFGIIDHMTITTKSERIGKFLTICSQDSPGRTVKYVFLNTTPVVHFDIHNATERKIAVIELVERSLCNHKTAGRLCGFHRNTVTNIVQSKKLLGIEAVFSDDRGLKKPYKYVEAVCSHIKELLSGHPEWKDQDIADQASKDLGIEISRSAVARIRTGDQESSMLPSKSKLLDLAKEAEAAEKEHRAKRQLWLNFDTEPELKQKSQECSKELPPRAENDTQRSLIAQLQQGEKCSFAGSLMHHLFLQEIGFEKIIAPLPLNPEATYQSSDILATIFHSIIHGIESIESLKLINCSEFGLLIGRSRIPDKKTLRHHLGQIAQQYVSEELIDAFARHLLEKQRIDREVFFIDGHFLPYYGLKVIAKGYYTVRRLAMKGNELYAVTDLQGRPLFFITESNEIDFRPIISRSAAMLQALGINRPILVFDRGGYGVHFFKDLGQSADFVTWAKYLSERSLNSIPEDAFTIGVCSGENHFLLSEEQRIVTESLQTALNDGRKTPTSLELRLVVLKDADTGKRMGIYTNNTSKPAYDIAYYMLQRWGNSENVYKELMDFFNLNYHPGYDIKELQQQPLVDNPDIPLTQKAIKVLKKEAEALEKDILITEAKLAKRQDKRLIKKLSDLKEALKEKMKDIADFQHKLSALPDKVSIIDVLKGKPMCRCDLEKKKLYDLMQFMAYHSRERLVELFKDCYDDHRDIKRVLDMITRRAGLVKLVGQTLLVMLEWIENKKHRQAAKKLCRKLNELAIRMVGPLDVKLSFYIVQYP
jgi:hypothetical protein